MKHLGAVITPEVETGEREKNIGAADIREKETADRQFLLYYPAVYCDTLYISPRYQYEYRNNAIVL